MDHYIAHRYSEALAQLNRELEGLGESDRERKATVWSNIAQTHFGFPYFVAYAAMMVAYSLEIRVICSYTHALSTELCFLFPFFP